jgi:hypothetical protein
LERQLKELLHDIRATTGFENFLAAPTEIECLGAAATGPIVVINPSICMHAFLIQQQGISVLELVDGKSDEMLAHIRSKATNSTLPINILE